MNNTVLAVKISPKTYEQITAKILDWARSGESRSVFPANVHMLMVAYDDYDFRECLNQADCVTADGMPLVWIMRAKGHTSQQRVYGPTLMLRVLEMAQKMDLPVGFLGSSPGVLEKLIKKMAENYPGLKINFTHSPPFRQLTEDEDALLVDQINKSCIRVLFVGLGCPKQEKWIASHRGKIPAVMIGVGAAFDFHAGVIPQSPPILQRIGFEWLFRLIHEPKRLWRRYLYNNPRFVFLAIADLLGFYRPK